MALHLSITSERLDGVDALHLSVTCYVSERLKGVEALHLSVTSERLEGVEAVHLSVTCQ